MNVIGKIQGILGFTRTEHRVVVFLVVTLLFGAAVKIIRGTYHQPAVYDYSASDSEFFARSALIDTGSSLSTERRDVVDSAGSIRRGMPRLHLGSIDVNTASKEELMSLPGIGEAIAERIVIDREENGAYASLNTLMRVKGIGKVKLKRITPFCRIGP